MEVRLAAAASTIASAITSGARDLLPARPMNPHHVCRLPVLALHRCSSPPTPPRPSTLATTCAVASPVAPRTRALWSPMRDASPGELPACGDDGNDNHDENEEIGIHLVEMDAMPGPPPRRQSLLGIERDRESGDATETLSLCM